MRTQLWRYSNCTTSESSYPLHVRRSKVITSDIPRCKPHNDVSGERARAFFTATGKPRFRRTTCARPTYDTASPIAPASRPEVLDADLALGGASTQFCGWSCLRSCAL